MEIPESRIDQALKMLCYPRTFAVALEARVKETGETPRRLWRLVVVFSILGVACYGVTIGLLVDSWPILGTALTLVAALVAGWIAFLGFALRGKAGPARWLRFHFAVLAILFGEFVFECGILANLLFWWADWLSEDQAIHLVLVWLLLADLVMLVTLITSWRAGGFSPGRAALCWLVFFQGAAVGVILILGPVLGIPI